jgi:hydrogenase maturation protease
VSDGRAELERPGPGEALVAGVRVRAGSRVVVRPRATQDVLMRALEGRRAIVSAVEQDLEDRLHVAVTLEDDPARAFGKGAQLGHRFFLDPDELEPLAPNAAAAAPPRRILVAGIGNVFLGDDGFGVALAERLAREPLPEGVDVADFGIRGMDLAYALADGYDAAVLLDAVPLGQPPGTLELIEPDLDDEATGAAAGFQAHGMDPLSVLRFARRFGSLPARTLVLGCEPGAIADPEGGEVDVGLSAPVAAAVEPAVALARALVEQLQEPVPAAGGNDR